MLPGGAFTVLLLLVGGVSAGELAFPPVELKNESSGVAVSFVHPVRYYKGSTLTDQDAFRFTVSTDAGDRDESCAADVCKSRIPFPEKCVALKGSLEGERVGKEGFGETGRMCLSVPPPRGVNLTCQNLNVSVSWEYSEPNPQTRFRVHVGGSAGHLVSETAEHRYDLSPFVWASEDRYLGFHFVTVTAKEGGNQSESIPSSTFSFNLAKLVDIRCHLDFPPVDLNENDSGATLSFMNPLLFYKELKRVSTSGTPTVTFTASSNNRDFIGECTAGDDLCKLDIAFPEGAEKCVEKLTGLLIDGRNLGRVPFGGTGPICASSSTEFHLPTFITLLFLLIVIVVGLIITLVCKVEAWTMKTHHKPVIGEWTNCERPVKYTPVHSPEISPVTVTEKKHSKSPSVSSEEKEEEEDRQDSGIGYPPNARLYAESGHSEDSADDSQKTETVSMDLEDEVKIEVEDEVKIEVEDEDEMVGWEEEEEEEEEASNYCPRTQQVDMGDGDMATAYSKS